MDSPNPKRPCNVPSITSSTQNPSSLPIAPSFNLSDDDLTISSFLSLPNSPVFSSPLSISCSFDRVLDKVITSATRDEFDQDGFLDRTLQLALLLYKSTKRCIRKRATLKNSITWPLLPELTTKVFSMLDTKSLMKASACCKMFNKFAMDSICYSNIDLTRAAEHVDDRAGKELRSLKLGSVSPRDRSTTPLLTRSCFSLLFFNDGFSGGLLRSLHLYNLRFMDSPSVLCSLLSVCPNLTDLKIFRFFSRKRVDPLVLLSSVTENCRLMEHLFIKICRSVVLETDSTSVEFVDNCPNLTWLSLLGCGLDDATARTIIKGFRQLKYLNLSLSHGITGSFLSEVGDSPVETLILRNCFSLDERDVSLFLNSLLAGDFKSFRHIDVSNSKGLAKDLYFRTRFPKFHIEELRRQRPGVTFLASFKPFISPYPSEEEEEEDEEEEDDDFE